MRLSACPSPLRQASWKARQSHNLSPVACAALGRTMTGAALLAGDYKNHEGVSIKIAGDGPLGAVHADCFDTNKLRGYVDNPTIDLPLKPNGKLDVSAAVGRNGQLTVTRFTPKTTTYTSQADLVSGEIAEDIAYYLYTSEQVPSTINLGVLVDRLYHCCCRRLLSRPCPVPKMKIWPASKPTSPRSAP